MKYWEDRALKYGERAVLNLNHTQDEISQVKKLQIETLFPLLKKELNGTEQTLLDFGCGPGRFSPELAQLINGKVVAVDPIEHLLQLAPKSQSVTYKKLINAIIPVQADSIDVIWTCLVLGGITSKKQMVKAIAELKRVSKNNTLLFLIENTTPQRNILSWHYRPISEYIDLLKEFNLKHLADYEDLNECNSVFAGRITKI